MIVTWNSGAEKLFGYAASEIVGRHISVLFPSDRLGEETVIIERLKKGEIIEQFETTRIRKGGADVPVSITVSPIKNANGETIGISKIAHDITERKRAEEQLLHDAFHDALTGLANRALFMDHLQFSIERGKSRHSNAYAVLFLDFDRFKVINDSLGHIEGDNFLKIAAHRLEHATRSGDLVARLGGDEFVVLLSELEKTEDAVQIAERIQENLKLPFKIGGREIFISASIGIALSTSGHARADDMLRDADIAMYRAKAKGRAGYQIFDAVMGEQAARQLSLETEMRHALERGEFELHYQPIIDLKSEKPTGFESLVRWRHPTRGMIPPLDFIAAAEENNFILPLGRWILEESCRQMQRWRQTLSAEDLTVSVNLSSKQFAQPDLVAQVAVALEKSELSPRCLKLEITESHIMENSEQAIQTISELRRLGVDLSLDDFGTGYSSLSYLHRLPASFLKIDRSFVSRMTDSEENAEIVSTIIKLARSLKMKTIAEGIENAEQFRRLKEMNCDYGQGYLFSKPLAANDAEKFIERAAGLSSGSPNETIINLETNA